MAVPNGATSATLTWNGLPGLVSGFTYARLRLTTDASIATGAATTSVPTGPALDGEVEDHAFTITVPNTCLAPFSSIPLLDLDFGDAPDVYGDACHNTASAPALYLGTEVPDNEGDTQLGGDGGVGADGDDGDGNDDEEGITFPALIQGRLATVMVSVVGSGGFLQGWIDWNGDGDFADSGEQVALDIEDNGVGDGDPASGTIALELIVPTTAITAPTYARFRWSSVLGLASVGSAIDGEVEDEQLIINPSFSVSGTVYHDLNHNGLRNGSESGTGLSLVAKIVPAATPGGPAIETATVNPVTGMYTLENVPTGTYHILVDDNATLTDVTPHHPNRLGRYGSARSHPLSGGREYRRI